MTTATTDTPRTDACPHCGAGKLDYTNYICGTTYSIESRGSLCHEREKSQKLQAEVERLRDEFLKSIVRDELQKKIIIKQHEILCQHGLSEYGN